MNTLTPGSRISGSGFDPETGGFKDLSVDGVKIDKRLIISAPHLVIALDRIMLKAIHRQAAGGDLFDFQDSLRECADIARAALAKVR